MDANFHRSGKQPGEQHSPKLISKTLLPGKRPVRKNVPKKMGDLMNVVLNLMTSLKYQHAL